MTEKKTDRRSFLNNCTKGLGLFIVGGATTALSGCKPLAKSLKNLKVKPPRKGPIRPAPSRQPPYRAPPKQKKDWNIDLPLNNDDNNES